MNQIFHTIFSRKYLFYTNSLGSGVLMCLGDTIQQTIEMYSLENKVEYDLKRIAHMGTIGLFMGPPQHYFYKYLDKYLPKRSMRSIAYKICLDQVIISPTCIIMFLGGLGILESKPPEEIQEEIRKKFLIIYTADCLLWPPCQFINFTYIKAKYRVMYVNAITVIYDIILSYIKYNDDLLKDKETVKEIGDKESVREEGDNVRSSENRMKHKVKTSRV